MPKPEILQLLCGNCNWKKIADDIQEGELFEIKTSPVPRGIPKRIKEKVVTPPARAQKRKFRCPKCGYVIIAKYIADPQKAMQLDAEEARRTNEQKKLEESIFMREPTKRTDPDEKSD